MRSPFSRQYETCSSHRSLNCFLYLIIGMTSLMFRISMNVSSSVPPFVIDFVTNTQNDLVNQNDRSGKKRGCADQKNRQISSRHGFYALRARIRTERTPRPRRSLPWRRIRICSDKPNSPYLSFPWTKSTKSSDEWLAR